jgi:ferredoxin-NADP reductase
LPVTMHVGRLDVSFFQTLEDVQDRTVFVCGPPAFEETSIQGLRSAGAGEGSISRENFTY